ncbi:MAG TPA: histidine phosphatase family protein [Microlunatus sp.]|nr:histidine phosphatase family protein [Microlunatus sp.]
MTSLYLVRHGETEWSRDGRHTSYTDLPLTEHGQEQARSLCGHLDPARFGLVLSSPRRRARETAELAGFVGRYTPQVDEDLAEWNYGDYEGLTRREIQEQEPGWLIWTHAARGGESADDIRRRLRRLIDRVESSGADPVICFAHGHSLRALMTVWLGLDLGFGANVQLDTATVSVLVDDDAGRSISCWNAPIAGARID